MVEKKEWITRKGWWKSANVFEDVFGHEHVVYPYNTDLIYYQVMFPLCCYMLTYGKVVKQIVYRDDT